MKNDILLSFRKWTSKDESRGEQLARIEYHTKKPLPTALLVVGLLVSILIIISSILLFFYPYASKEEAAYFRGEFPILFKGKQAGNAVMEGNTLYVPYSFVKKIDDTIAFDQKSHSVIITTQDKVVQMPSDSVTYFVNEKPVKLQIPTMKAKGKEFYLALDQLLAFYPIKYEVLKDTKAIWIHKSGEVIKYGEINKKDVHEEKLRLRVKPELKSPYTVQTIPGERIFIENKEGDYYFVRNANGIAGFVHEKFIRKLESEMILVEQEVRKGDLPEINGPIHLTWEAVYTKNPDTSKIPEMLGVNIVSPTWFKLGSPEGAIHNLGSIEYVNWAKGKGYQVWGLFSNDFNPDLTHTAFSDFETRQNMIRQLLHFSQMYQLDGINIDIENVRVEDGPFVTQFVREATPYFHGAGLYVSMDITFISGSGNWSAFYERDKLAGIVDYLIVMAYDEHWGSSRVSGSVASLPWVEKNLQKLLEVVPQNKLILGVPLYTRLWTEQMDEDGAVTVSSKSMTMAEVNEWLETKKIIPVYDESTGQNYAEYYSAEEKATYKIWLEDETSLKKRVELTQKYQLAGIATWSRYFAAPHAWAALQLPDNPPIAKE